MLNSSRTTAYIGLNGWSKRSGSHAKYKLIFWHFDKLAVVWRWQRDAWHLIP